MKKHFIIALLVAGGLWTSSCEKKTESTTEEVTTTEQNASAGSATVPANDPATNPNVTGQEEVNPNAPKPVMTFKETEHDFGNIKSDKKVQHTFTFTNTGQAPLIIENATATCGCTVPEWPKEPVLPGKTGTIKVEYDPAGRTAQQSKQITITANTEPSINQLTIRANVVGAVPQAGAAGPVRL
jgi:FtsZ-interacting cell division protein ZipA